MAPDGSRFAAQRFFHGWVVVGAAFAIMFLGFGGAYSFAAFSASLQQEFSVSRGPLSLAFSIAGALWFTIGALSGPLADRFGPKGTALAGMTIAGVGLIVASQAQALWQIYVGYGVGIGVGIGFAYVPSLGAVQHWFVRRRGFASGVAVSGIGLGTVCAPPIEAWLIDTIGWRGAYLAWGAAILIGGSIAALLLDADPHRRGFAPDNDPLAADAPRPAASGYSLGEALRTRAFWLLYLASSSASMGLFTPFVHLTLYAEDRGIGHSTAVFLFSLIGIGSIGGRFLLGSLADRLGRRASFGAMFLGMGLMMLWWLASSAVWQLAIFALVFGVFYGGFVALAPAITVDYFGNRHASGIIGILYTSVGIGTLAGPSLAGVIFDHLRSYTIPISAGAIFMLLAVLCIAFMGSAGTRPP